MARDDERILLMLEVAKDARSEPDIAAQLERHATAIRLPRVRTVPGRSAPTSQQYPPSRQLTHIRSLTNSMISESGAPDLELFRMYSESLAGAGHYAIADCRKFTRLRTDFHDTTAEASVTSRPSSNTTRTEPVSRPSSPQSARPPLPSSALN